jgi:mono/diheme cytochrome c family protein
MVTLVLVSSLLGQHAFIPAVPAYRVAPSYSYAPTYQKTYKYQNFAEIKTIFVPAPYAFYSEMVGQLARQQAPAPAVTVQPAPQVAAPAPAPQQPQPSTAPAPVAESSDLDRRVNDWMATDCKSCHTAGALRGNGFAILNADGSRASLTPFDKHAIAVKVLLGDMPPAKPYPRDRQQAFADWDLENSDAFLSLLNQAKKRTN